ncbi:cdc42-interacting protein 4 homolog isoform X2 [Brienomyrus brachyistius]|uniref:cdc42-interacting protein 4 homolog isoform X2 n=1 Tax=Brienomyrus brachyistius TaxID=42636 RepID=UPI0020B2C337|nr:cdc42-interacting protein 4 homolog isoform X2 [Brienomyrus brachyistius]
MDWGTELWDQCDTIDKHTQSGLELVEKYVKFVKERTEIEQQYAKQLRNLVKKYASKRGKDDQENRFTNHQSFQDILNEMNDYAGQREVIAENMMVRICCELTKYLQELKQERKSYLLEAKRAQQSLENGYKQLESSKKRFEREWREAERAAQYAEKTDQDINATKADVEKAKQQAHLRTHLAEECKNEYASQLQKFNKEQNQFYYSSIPQVFNKLQDMDERRVRRLAEGYALFADTEKQVLPIIGKCLEGITKASGNTDSKQDSLTLIEQHKSGFERPGDLEFEDYSQGINRTSSESSLGTPKGPLELLGKNKNKLWPFSKKSKVFVPEKSVPTATEDFTHLPPEQRRKKLQRKMDDIGKELQKEQDQSEALLKMKDVYEKNPQMGNPDSLSPQITQTAQNMERLRGELAKYESWLIEAGGRGESVRYASHLNNNGAINRPNNANSREGDIPQPIYAEFEDDFDDEELDTPIGQCTALYSFPGSSEGTLSMQEGDVLSVVEEDKGDGWTRVRRSNGDEGYIPTSYVKITIPQ